MTQITSQARQEIKSVATNERDLFVDKEEFISEVQKLHQLVESIYLKLYMFRKPSENIYQRLYYAHKVVKKFLKTKQHIECQSFIKKDYEPLCD